MSEPALREARSPADWAAMAQLFRAYQAWLGIDLCFQGFEGELASLPGPYAAPAGIGFLAEIDGRPAGCIAVKPLGDGACEMKRLWVAEEARGLGLGRTLATRAIGWARAAGYRTMRLDTLERMGAAVALYRRLGFRPIAPYIANPYEDVLYLGLDLEPAVTGSPRRRGSADRAARRGRTPATAR